MPPELLAVLESGSENYDQLKKVDVWSIGCILLEILTGVPLWFRYKCRVEVKGRQTVQLGFFALTGRDYQKIIKKQRELCDNLHKVAITHKELEKYRPILKKILVFNPDKRPTIQECLELFDLVE
jgi:dual specificity tyrosine-phosphorylation-regulated kinase 2/3/4